MPFGQYAQVDKFIIYCLAFFAQGMMVLHNSPVQVHGRLKSSNCLIDSRWVCKIGDWGLSELRSPSDRLQPQEEHEKYNGKSRDIL